MVTRMTVATKGDHGKTNVTVWTKVTKGNEGNGGRLTGLRALAYGRQELAEVGGLIPTEPEDHIAEGSAPRLCQVEGGRLQGRQQQTS